MPRYLALSDGYLGRRPGFVTKGTEFDYDGKPGKWMLLVKPSQAAKAPVLSKAEQAKADKEAAKAAAKARGDTSLPANSPGAAASGSGDKDVI